MCASDDGAVPAAQRVIVSIDEIKHRTNREADRFQLLNYYSILSIEADAVWKG